MSAWSAFYPWVLPHVRGCPNPMINRALCDAAREFCARSRAWQVKADPVVSDGTTRTLSFVFPTGGELVRVERATVAGEDWTVLNADAQPADADEDSPEESLEDTLVVISKTQYQLWPLPSSGDEIVVHLALQPAVAAAEVGDVIYEQWGEGLAQGAIFRLKAMSKADWSDADGAALASSAFERAIHRAANWKFRQNRQLRTTPAPL